MLWRGMDKIPPEWSEKLIKSRRKWEPQGTADKGGNTDELLKHGISGVHITILFLF